MYLVTGGAGFIGSNIVAELERRGMGPVVICDQFGSDGRWKNIRGRAISSVPAPSDLFQWLPENVGAMKGLIHMGAITSTTERDVDALLSANARLTSNLFVLAGLHGIPFVYASSASIYGRSRRQSDADEHLDAMEPLCAYGWSKKLADQMILARVDDFRRVKGGEPERWAGLRFFNVYGPGEAHKGDQRSYVSKCLDGGADADGVFRESSALVIFDGSERFARDWVWVGDCAQIVAELLQSGKPFTGIYNVGTGRARSFHEVLAACGAVAKRGLPMPQTLRDQYQEFTEAETLKFKRLMPHFKFASLEEGVELYRSFSASCGGFPSDFVDDWRPSYAVPEDVNPAPSV